MHLDYIIKRSRIKTGTEIAADAVGIMSGTLGGKPEQ